MAFPFVRSSRQASHIYGLEGPSAPRPRNLFAVCFRKAGASSTTGLNTGIWAKDLGFMVKTVDRPSVEPKVEEVNQYNKKRLITTGYKIGPTRMTFYDTADSLAMSMFAEYSKYYYGDFRHTSTADWKYDVTLPEFSQQEGPFGFAPSAADQAASDFNSQFFFEAISVYQVFGAEYVQYDLVNPRITSFDPDELDFQNSDIATISMTVQCEAILYKNDFQPRPISSDAFLAEAFGDITGYDGDIFEVATAGFSDPTALFSYPSPNPIGAIVQTAVDTLFQAPAAAADLRAYDNTISGGTLSAFGQYNFGSSVSGARDAPFLNLTADLSQAAVSNPVLATALSLGEAALSAAVNPLVSSNAQLALPSSISQDIYDQARSAVAAAGLDYGRIDNAFMGDALVYGALSAALASQTSPREQIYNRQTPVDPIACQGQRRGRVRHYDQSDDGVNLNVGKPGFPQPPLDGPPPTVAPNSWSSADARSLSLSRQAYGVINAQRSGTSQIGFNERTRGSNAGSQPPGVELTVPRKY